MRWFVGKIQHVADFGYDPGEVPSTRSKLRPKAFWRKRKQIVNQCVVERAERNPAAFLVAPTYEAQHSPLLSAAYNFSNQGAFAGAGRCTHERNLSGRPATRRQVFEQC